MAGGVVVLVDEDVPPGAIVENCEQNPGQNNDAQKKHTNASQMISQR